MEWKEGTLVLLDQTRLPAEVTWISCTTAERVREAIARLEVRGAPAIGAAAAFAMVLGWRGILREQSRAGKGKEPPASPSESYLPAFAALKERLDSARPTAINLAWATKRLYDAAARLAAGGETAKAVSYALETLAKRMYDQDIAVNKAMGQYGAACVPDDAVILTHCNAGALATCGWGTALGVIRSAAAAGKVRQVYADETRPLLQGARLTVW